MGGKGVRHSWIVGHLPPHEAYVEAFGGAAPVLLNKPRPKRLEVYNDLDGLWHNSIAVIRDHPQELAEALAATPYSRDEFLRATEMLREWHQHKTPAVELARLHFVVVRQSFSADGQSWLTCGKRNYAGIWSRLPDEVLRAAIRLQGVYIECRDYGYILSRYDRERVTFYLDPPFCGVEDRYYDVNKTGGFDHRALRDAVEPLAGSVVISYYDRPEIRELYAGWRIETKPVIVHAGSVMRDDTELLIIRPSAWAAAHAKRKRIRELFDAEGNAIL
jgi:DNA adenine methylase